MTDSKHTNRLINETSPYLLQHAHNPVDWYPWGAEAFDRARQEDKPVLLSIGYSACHWCHVMERESFESEEIAALMNEHFISIKVDREERPDLDQIYMNAVQMMTHHGGWPMTVFLTADGAPFFGGTYFPPEDRYNMPGFPRVLIGVAEAYATRRDEIGGTAVSLIGELRRLGLAGESREMLTGELLETAYRGITRNYDATFGGFGGAPKFPPAMTLDFLLRTYFRNGRPEALEMVRQTCELMARGGIYDQLGGGFHRYATDNRWLVPHFEKMLYDNALITRLYLHYYQVSHDQLARRVVEETLDYLIREMTSPEGGFYSTQDADSEGEEGKYFVWTPEEINELLGPEDAKIFCEYFDVTPDGNFEGHNILNVPRSADDVAKSLGISTAQLHETIERGRKALFAARERRVKPDRDEKILTAWNGLMLAAVAEAAAVLDREDYAAVARKNAQFLLGHLERDGLLLRTWKDGTAKLNAYLEDYAFLIDGLLCLFEATGEFNWFDQARALSETMIDEFWDDQDGGFYFTGKSHEQLIVRSKDYFDNATPSGNSVAADVLLRLALLTGSDHYRRLSVTVLRLAADSIKRYPSGFGRMLGALDFYLGKPKEVVIVGESSSAATHSLTRVFWDSYLPNRVLISCETEDAARQADLPLLRERTAVDGRPTAYVCENFTCQMPATKPEALRAQLGARAAAGSD